MRLSILITGGLGQVGSYIAEALIERGHYVTILDNMYSGSNIPPKQALFVKGDIRNEKIVRPLVRDSDAVFHLAAQIFVAKSVEDPVFDAENNVMGTLNLLDAARDAKLKRLIYFSSAAVYGDSKRLPVDEDHPQSPLSPYGVSKLSGEKYTIAFNKVYGLPTTVIRPFNIYSPRQDPSNPYSGVIARFIDRACQGLPPVILGDGSATRDFVSVHDVADMAMLMLDKEAAVGKVLNCGTGFPTSIGELAGTVVKLCGLPDLKPEHAAERPGDIPHSYADISLARSLLGYAPKVRLDEGLREIVAQKMQSKF